MQGAVRQAFLERPHLVDDAAGFLGMEVLLDHQDDSIFHLLTRWTDEESFRAWHSSPLHKSAHRGIPKGLKLDPSHTRVRVLEIIPCGNEPEPIPAADPSLAELARFVAHTRSFHWLRASREGCIVAANPAFESLLQEPAGALVGRSVWDLVTQPDAASIQTILTSGNPDPGAASVLLNFVDRNNNVYTLECHLEAHQEDFLLVGEPVREQDQSLAQELLQLNNRWALLARENEKNAKALRQAKEELEKALDDLNRSHWHIRKIQETLPICMYCGKVKTAEAEWQELVDYMKENSLFLSHGCCPTCLEKILQPGGEFDESER